MFYKSSSRSTVLKLRDAQRAGTVPAQDDVLDLADEVVAVNREAESKKNTKLSAFERDMLEAWAQD